MASATLYGPTLLVISALYVSGCSVHGPDRPKLAGAAADAPSPQTAEAATLASTSISKPVPAAPPAPSVPTLEAPAPVPAASTPSNPCASGAAVGSLLDPCLHLSPYNWNKAGGQAQSNTPGAYLKATFTGLDIYLLVDTAINAGLTPSDYPVISVTIDGSQTNTIGRYQLQAADRSIHLNVKPLAAGNHTLLVDYAGLKITTLAGASGSVDRWNAAPGSDLLRVTGLNVPAGSLQPSAPGFWSDRKMIAFGDSISEAVNVLYGIRPGAVAYSEQTQDAALGWPRRLAAKMGVEVGVVGYSSSSYYGPGLGNAPAAFDAPGTIVAWDHYDANTSRLNAANHFSDGDPAFAISGHGRNGTFGAFIYQCDPTRDSVATTLTSLRGAAPQSTIFIATPYNGNNNILVPAGTCPGLNQPVFTLSTGFANYQSGFAAHPAHNDAKMFYVDAGNIEATYGTADGVHPGVSGQEAYAAALCTAINAQTKASLCDNSR